MYISVCACFRKFVFLQIISLDLIPQNKHYTFTPQHPTLLASVEAGYHKGFASPGPGLGVSDGVSEFMVPPPGQVLNGHQA